MKLKYVIAKLALLLLLFGILSLRAAAVGPNLLANSSFEGGNQDFSIPSSNFSIIDSPSNAHTGSYVMQAVLADSWVSTNYPNLLVWANTSYTASIWVKGSGSLIFNCLGSNWSTVLGTTTINATSTWTKYSFTFNTSTYSEVEINLYDGAGGGGTAYLDDISVGVTNGSDIGFNPSNPGAYGFNYLVYDDEFNSAGTIDSAATGNDGYNWYTKQFFGYPTTTSSSYAVGSSLLSINNAPDNWGDTLHTAMPSSDSQGWKGTAFAAGTGFYAEARIACANLSSIGTNGWPAFWMADMKTNTGLNEGMPGNSGYSEEIENDIMEYNPAWWDLGADYGSTMHDWPQGPGISSGYGLSNANATVAAPVGTNYTAYHTYGMLLIPATSANGWNGYREAFFDGVPQGAVSWIGNQNYTAGVFPETAASMGSYEFSLDDPDMWDIILGSSQGGTITMYVDYVHVFAVSPLTKVTIWSNAPSTPTSLTAVSNSNDVFLNWTAATGDATYNVYRGTSSGGESGTPNVTGLAKPTYTDTSGATNKKYYYRIAAVNNVGTSGYSNEASATTLYANVLTNPGFESGTSGWTIFNNPPFAAQNNGLYSHSGTCETVLNPTLSWDWLSQNVAVTASTNYTASIWVSGSGKFQFEVWNSAWTTILASAVVTAGSGWTQVVLPTFNTGSNTAVYYNVYDSEASGGTAYLDDCYLGVN